MSNSFWKQARLELTGRCNLRCSYCYASQKNSSYYIKNELSLEKWFQVIEECKGMGIDYFALIGGEPLLYPNFWDIVKKLENCFVAVTTNATLVNEEFIEKLKLHPQLQEIRISIDGLESNDKVRVGSSYKEILEKISLLNKKTDLKITIQTTLNEQNIKEIDRLYSLLKDLNIYKWRINPFQYYLGDNVKNNENEIEFKSYDSLVQEMKKIVERDLKERPDFDLEIYMFYHSNIAEEGWDETSLTDHPCEYRLPMLCIQANGDIAFCPVLDMVFSNIKDYESLKEAAETESRLKWEYFEIKDTECKNCKYVKICSTGCRERSLSLLKKIEGPDPVACCIIPKIYAEIVPILPEEQRKIFLDLVDHNGDEPVTKGNNIEDAIKNYRKKR